MRASIFRAGDSAAEKSLRDRITWIWRDAEWSWHTRDGRQVLTWHWSPNNGFSLDHEIRGWNECLIAYVLAAASPHYSIDPAVYHDGFAQSRTFINRRRYYDLELPLGPDYGGPLFFSHYSFCGLDPRGLRDRLCGLLATKRPAYLDQLRALRPQSEPP